MIRATIGLKFDNQSQSSFQNNYPYVKIDPDSEGLKLCAILELKNLKILGRLI